IASKRWSGISTITVWPDSAHSFSVFFSSVSRRLSGIVLMAMKYLTFDDQLVSYFAAHEEHDDLTFIHIKLKTALRQGGSGPSAHTPRSLPALAEAADPPGGSGGQRGRR